MIFNSKSVCRPDGRQKTALRHREVLSTSLREVLGYIKYSGNKKQLHSFTENNPRMTMETNAVRVIRTITNTPVEISEKAEEVNMCKAIEEMMEDSRQEGRQEGIREGEASGARKKAKETACALSSMGLSAEQIASAVSMELGTVKEWILHCEDRKLS